MRSNGDYGLVLGSENIPEAVLIPRVDITFWGVPADPSHDFQRCAKLDRFVVPPACTGQSDFEEPHSLASPKAFLTMPTACTTPGAGARWDLRTSSWPDPDNYAEATVFTHEAPGFPEPTSAWGPQRGVEDCDVVPFSPDITVQPTTNKAESPTGLDVSLTMPTDGLLNPEGIAQSHLKRASVALPEGMSINPAIGGGLDVCTPAQYASENVNSTPGTGCPSTAKVGSVQIESPLLKERLDGSLYVAQQDDPGTTGAGAENPFDSLLALYVVVKNPERGVIIKLAGKVSPDPRTGQLVTTFDQNPQLPFSSFKLHFREGARSPLSTPPACGTYTTTAKLTPWSAPATEVEDTTSFQITEGINGTPCPSANTPPFKPGLQAGTINNRAGSYSPFNVRLTREDGEQEITNFSIKLPPGVIGKIAGLGSCSDAAIEAARHKTGTQELASPSCPASSQVGKTLAGAGVGASLVYAPGKIYFAGPYHGAPISLVSITAAKVGPFDLGTVVVRFALKIDPVTAEVFIDATGSDPIPHIVQGIPLHVRDIRAYNDRPEFVLNPTSCERTSTASTVLGSGLDFASAFDDKPVTVSTPFQAADCAALNFKPKLSLTLKGGTKRGGHPSLKATLKMKAGEANIARAQVTLPKSEFLDQSHIGTVCTRVQYAKDQCPAKSVYGYARAITPLLDEPLAGPVYLRSSEHKLPDLVAGLKSGKIEIDLAGRIDSVEGQIRTTFESVPDAPVSTFTLTMAGGKKGLLENSTNLCARPHKAIIEFDGQNGKIKDSTPVLKPQCKGKKKSKAAKRRNAR
jgi:hypothetical protein